MQIIAHRGASGYEPENTLIAFKKAIELGADMIELDVYQLKTGELVVIHDRTVNRTTNGVGHIEQLSLADLRKLDAGHGEKVPLLRDVFEVVNQKIPINIELKGYHIAEPVASLLAEYINEKGWSPDSFIVSSFHHHELQIFMKLLPAVPVGALFNRIPFHLMPIVYQKNVASINLNAKHVTARQVQSAHLLGKKVYVYTVNDRWKADHLQALHVDGIFTNYPDIIGPTAPRLRKLAHFTS